MQSNNADPIIKLPKSIFKNKTAVSVDTYSPSKDDDDDDSSSTSSFGSSFAGSQTAFKKPSLLPRETVFNQRDDKRNRGKRFSEPIFHNKQGEPLSESSNFNHVTNRSTKPHINHSDSRYNDETSSSSGFGSNIKTHHTNFKEYSNYEPRRGAFNRGGQRNRGKSLFYNRQPVINVENNYRVTNRSTNPHINNSNSPSSDETSSSSSFRSNFEEQGSRFSEPLQHDSCCKTEDKRFSEPLCNQGVKKGPTKPRINWPSQGRPPRSLTNDEFVFVPSGARQVPHFPSKSKIQSNSVRDNFRNNRGHFQNNRSRSNFQNNRGRNNYHNRHSSNGDGDDEEENWEVPTISQAQFNKLYVQNHADNRAERFDKTETCSEKEIDKTKKCDCDNCDSFTSCPVWRENHLIFKNTFEKKLKLPLLKADDHQQEQDTVLHKIFNNDLLIHGKEIPRIKTKNCFNEKVQNILANINCDKANNTQNYIWPSILRKLNAFIIGPPKSGKTFSYLPAMFSFALDSPNTCSELACFDGPLIIILCLNETICNELEKSCQPFLSCSILKNLKETDLTDKINYDIIITTPAVLISALKRDSLTLKRVCHVIVENADLLLKEKTEQVQTVFKLLNEIQSNRPSNSSIQTVVVSERWSLDLEALLKKLAGETLVCFGDYLEAAHYGKIESDRKSIKKLHKALMLNDILKKMDYRTKKSIVFCEEGEISTLSEGLMLKGVENIVLSSEFMEDEIAENEDTFCFLKQGQYKTLVCSDQVFDLASKVKNADLIVHFSYPDSMEQFKRRYRSLAANISSPLEKRTDNIWHVFLIDETTENHVILKEFLQSLSRHLVNCFKL